MPKKSFDATPALFPAPVAMVTCGTMAQPNIVTLAWTGVVCSDPPMLSIAIRPSRYSNGLVRASQEFVVNIPPATLLDQMELCGTKSGREVDKFKACQLTPEAASVVNVPLIAECPINIECVVTQVLSLGTHDLFLGRIVAARVDETALDDKGELDATRIQPITYVMRKFYGLGEHLISS
jgi:flavin reductase (DIM6/NTAB) family NADH-FMN oxidoreductase RutF